MNKRLFLLVLAAVSVTLWLRRPHTLSTPAGRIRLASDAELARWERVFRMEFDDDDSTGHVL